MRMLPQRLARQLGFIKKRSVSPRDPAHKASKKASQVRGYRAGGVVTIIVDERDILP